MLRPARSRASQANCGMASREAHATLVGAGTVGNFPPRDGFMTLHLAYVRRRLSATAHVLSVIVFSLLLSGRLSAQETGLLAGRRRRTMAAASAASPWRSAS